MEQHEAFVKMNEYVMKQYQYAVNDGESYEAINRYWSVAYGAFQMFMILYPNAFTDEEYDRFWEFYRDAFDDLVMALLMG